ncbi:MAG: TolC family protein, partial [Candidatus Sumerlaeota bacterium]
PFSLRLITLPFRLLFFAGILAISLLSPHLLRAQTPTATPAGEPHLTLADLFRIANERNHELLAQQRRIDAMKGRLRQSRLYPNPVVGAQSEEIPSHSLDASEGKSSVSLGQPIVVGKRLRAAAAVENAEIARAEAELEKMRWRLNRDIEKEYISILYNRDALELQIEFIEVSRDLKNDVMKSAKNDLDAERVELEIQDLRRMMLRCITQRAQGAARIGALIGTSELDFQHLDGELERGLYGPQLGDSQDDIVRRHPEMILARKRIEAATKRLALARSERVPDVTLSGSVGYDGANDGGMIGVGVSVPIPIWDIKQGAIAEATSMISAAEQDEENTFLQLNSQLAESILALNETDTLITDYEKNYSPTATSSWEKGLARNHAGSTDITETIDVFRTYVKVRQTELEYIRDFNYALSDIKYFEGYDSPKPTSTPPVSPPQ